MANKTKTDDWYEKYLAANDKAQSYADQFANREPFKFDVNSDPLYEQLKDQYVQQGKLAAMDTMGQAATLTGGYGSSYAQSVGQQTYNQYMSQLNSAIPDLYESAYAKWQNDGNDLYSKYSLYADARDNAKTELEAEQNNMLTKIAGGYQATDKELEKLGLTKNDVDAYLSASTKTAGKEQSASQDDIDRVKKRIAGAENEDELDDVYNSLLAEGWGKEWVEIWVMRRDSELTGRKTIDGSLAQHTQGSLGRYTY